MARRPRRSLVAALPWKYRRRLLDNLPGRFPRHVFRLNGPDHVSDLLAQGRPVDESVRTAPPVNSALRVEHADNLDPMALPKAKRSVVGPEPREPRREEEVPPFRADSRPEDRTPIRRGPWAFDLIWESRELKERDLNIPSGSTTHATGSMLWKKGAFDGIDPRHYFYDVAFAGLAWTRDAGKPHLLRAKGGFHFVVKDVYCGAFVLSLTHNTDTYSATYAQKNSMTQIHWGEALRFIAKRDLLGRVMRLFRNPGTPPEFMVRID